MGTSPVISSITFDKVSYNPGDKITATITYIAGTAPLTFSFTDVATDKDSGLSGTMTVSFTVSQPDTVTQAVSDTGNRTWSQVSDTGAVTVFTATA